MTRFTLSSFKAEHKTSTKEYGKASAVLASSDVTQIAKWQSINTMSGEGKRQIMLNLARLVLTNIAIPEKASAWTFSLSLGDYFKRWHTDAEAVAYNALTKGEQLSFQKDWSRYIVGEAQQGKKPGQKTPANPKAKPLSLSEIKKGVDSLSATEKASLVAYIMGESKARKTA